MAAADPGLSCCDDILGIRTGYKLYKQLQVRIFLETRIFQWAYRSPGLFRGLGISSSKLNLPSLEPGRDERCAT